MNNQSPLPAKINHLLERVVDASNKASAGGILPKLAQDLIGSGDLKLVPALTAVLQELFVQGKLDLPQGAATANHVTPAVVNQATAALSAALTAAGHPGLAAVSAAAIDLLKSKISSCGVLTNTPQIPGPGVGIDHDQDVILYFVEFDNNRDAILPPVKGSKALAYGLLQRGFINWATRLNLIVNRVSNHQEANLVVTGAHMGNGPVLARTEIGPPQGRQLRMVFNLDKTDLSADEFESNVAHEFGHALGIVHEDVRQDGTQVMNDTLLGVKDPQGPGEKTDLQAAQFYGWRIA